ncbi:uncharacterized protein LOC112566788 isoform X2 [Pomacea canaliculata]|uniref:uncharacterized protein LOC112566788 isoform X2 n=1 Tax=Pomacea canaliculata TaxID=400727 RepID=UPI000D729CFE|nr:uncharacterized protein LOC112566788 isoform X2 [Pomacea canaliculata]
MTTTTLSTVMLLMLLVALALGSVIVDEKQYPFRVNCGWPRICTPDLIRYCIKGRLNPVYGSCEIQEAICNGEDWDPSKSCFLPYPVFCDLPHEERPCYLDLSPWCLEGRSEPVHGHCELQDAICNENAVFDVSHSCLTETSLSVR